MNRREFTKSMLAGATAIAAPNVAHSQTVYNLKLGHFISPQHIMSVYLQKWVDELKEKSNGRLNITIFPANTMGPVQNYADYARTGVADITWFLHGATPGRFPLTEVIQLPYMVGSAEIGTKVLNDPEVLKLLEPEYQGVKISICSRTSPAACIHPASRCAPSTTSRACAFVLPRSRSKASSPPWVALRSACRPAALPTLYKRTPSTAASSITAALTPHSASVGSLNTLRKCTPMSAASA